MVFRSKPWFSALLLASACATGCGEPWSEHSGGDMGKADFSYAGFITGDQDLEDAMLNGAEATIRIRLHPEVQDTAITVISADPATFTVSSFGRGTDRGEWQAIVHGAKVGSAKLTLKGPDGKPLDTISLAIAEPAKIVAPGSVSMSVGDKKKIETHVEDKDGKTLHVSSALEWTLDADVATFYAPLDQQTGQTSDVGTVLDLVGNRPGPTTLRGHVGSAHVELNVTVNP